MKYLLRFLLEILCMTLVTFLIVCFLCGIILAIGWDYKLYKRFRVSVLIECIIECYVETHKEINKDSHAEEPVKSESNEK